MSEQKKPCNVAKCPRPVVARGLCVTHYVAERRAAARPPVDADEKSYGGYRATIDGRPFSLNAWLLVRFADGVTRRVRLEDVTDMIASADGWALISSFDPDRSVAVS